MSYILIISVSILAGSVSHAMMSACAGEMYSFASGLDRDNKSEAYWNRARITARKICQSCEGKKQQQCNAYVNSFSKETTVSQFFSMLNRIKNDAQLTPTQLNYEVPADNDESSSDPSAGGVAI